MLLDATALNAKHKSAAIMSYISRKVKLHRYIDAMMLVLLATTAVHAQNTMISARRDRNTPTHANASHKLMIIAFCFALSIKISVTRIYCIKSRVEYRQRSCLTAIVMFIEIIQTHKLRGQHRIQGVIFSVCIHWKFIRLACGKWETGRNCERVKQTSAIQHIKLNFIKCIRLVCLMFASIFVWNQTERTLWNRIVLINAVQRSTVWNVWRYNWKAALRWMWSSYFTIENNDSAKSHDNKN